MWSKAKSNGLRRGELGAVLTALCALLAVAPHARASLASAAPRSAATQQVMLWWLQSTLATQTPEATSTFAPHEAAALLASLQEVQPAAVTTPLTVQHSVSEHSPLPGLWQHAVPLSSLIRPTTEAVHLLRPTLEFHTAALLSGIRTNIILE